MFFSKALLVAKPCFFVFAGTRYSHSSAAYGCGGSVIRGDDLQEVVRTLLPHMVAGEGLEPTTFGL